MPILRRGGDQGKRYAGIILPLCLGIVLFAIESNGVEANQIAIYVIDVQTYATGDVITVTERIRIQNGESSPLTGVAVLGGDAGRLKGQVLYVGFVPPMESADSTGAFEFTIDLSQTPMRSFSLPVTIQYVIDGEAKEVQTGLAIGF